VTETVQTRITAALDTALEPVAGFLRDARVVEVMINPDGSVWVEQLRRAPARADVTLGPLAADRLARAIVAAVGGELNGNHPTLSCMVPGYGARAQILAPPVVDATTVVLRRPASQVLPLSHYVQQEVLQAQHARAIERAVHERRNVLIGGGTGSGKTTFANAVLGVLAGTNERVLTIEDTRELQCAVDDCVQVRVVPALYSWRQAVVDAMRMRPDRIIVGEVRDGAALDLLKAWNTGHPGGIATIHADSAVLMLERFCQLIEEVVPRAPREVVASTIHVCVHMQRDAASPAGRVITQVARVCGYDGGWLIEDMEVA